MAEDRHQRCKEELDRLFADMDHEVRAKRDAIVAQNPKFKMTEPMIENEIKSDKRYQAKLSEVQIARYLAKVLKNAPQAFAHRRDMLLELGKHATTTMTDPRVSSGQQQQVRKMFAAKAARTLPAAPAVDVPDDLEAGLIAPEGEVVEFNPPVDEPTASTARRRAPKTA
jgi:hypothetical protein